MKSSGDLEKLRHFVRHVRRHGGHRQGRPTLPRRAPDGARRAGRHARRRDAVPEAGQRRRPGLRGPGPRRSGPPLHPQGRSSRTPTSTTRLSRSASRTPRCATARPAPSCFDDLATDKRFLQYMDEPGDVVGKHRFKGELEDTRTSTRSRSTCSITFEPLNDPLPAPEAPARRDEPQHQPPQAGGPPRPARSKCRSRSTRTSTSSCTRAEHGHEPPGFANNGQPQAQANRFGYHSVGHLVVANLGQYLVAVDAVTHRKLWDKNLLGDHSPATAACSTTRPTKPCSRCSPTAPS